jgi:N-formylglutamate deformylase
MYPETILPIVAHIPHAGTEIPNSVHDQFLTSPGDLWREIARVTDWYTDELFGIPGIAVSQTPINRVVVDLERYCDDSLEEKSAFGQGVIYTHNTLGEQIRRELSRRERQQLLDTYYRPWHQQLQLNVEQQLAHWGHCLLLDCHSFPDEPFGHEDDHEQPRPDICLGSCGNTPQWLLDACQRLFLERGYTVSLDFPYSGCLVPDRYSSDLRVPAIMVEINRRLYMESGESDADRLGNLPIRLDGFESLKNDIWSVVLKLAHEMTCKLPVIPPTLPPLCVTSS